MVAPQKEFQGETLICKTSPVFTASGKKSKKNKQLKYPLYWNCIVTHCPFHADEHHLWTKSISSNHSLSCFLKGMYLFSNIPNSLGLGAQLGVLLLHRDRRNLCRISPQDCFCSCTWSITASKREWDIHWVVTVLTTPALLLALFLQ